VVNPKNNAHTFNSKCSFIGSHMQIHVRHCPVPGANNAKNKTGSRRSLFDAQNEWAREFSNQTLESNPEIKP
jgi:hypothetical protein